MSNREPIKTTKEEIISYWSKYQDECELSVDWAEASERCWRCGCTRTLERCHITPYALGGKDAPENLVLLYNRCHTEEPNVNDPEIMWEWIKAYRVPLYDTFWTIEGMRKYQFIYKHSFKSAVSYILTHTTIQKNENEISEYLKQEIQSIHRKSSTHFGQNYRNTATYAGKFRMLIKSLAKEMNVSIEKMDEEISENASTWWTGCAL